MKGVTFIAGLLILLALFFAINVLASAALGPVKFDLTERKLYTLSDGSRQIAAEVQEPIRLRLYFSQSLATARPALKTYGERVREMLEEYVDASGGTISLEVIDPEPFSEAEDEAVQAGVAGLPASQQGENFYFGLVGTNTTDGREVLPFLNPADEQFLEYQVSRMVHALGIDERTVVGVISSLPIDGGAGNPMMGQQAAPPWQIMNEMRGLFEVRMLEPAVSRIEGDVDVLLVIHPKNLLQPTAWAIDQFVLGGGRVIVFVDPHCEVDAPPNPRDQMSAFQHDRSSGLPALFEKWGVQFDQSTVVTDAENAQQVTAPTQQGGMEQVIYLPWLALDSEDIDNEDAVTGRLSSIYIGAGGGLSARDGAATTFQPLMWSSTDSATVESFQMRFPNPRGLLTSFEADAQRYVFAARISGPVSTAFPGGRPGGAADEGDDAPAPLTESVEPANLIVVADVDMLADRFWLRQEMLLGQIPLGYRKLAENGDFLINALDNLSGSSALISIRARGEFSRPFELVEEIRRRAQQEHLAEEQRLEEKLAETEQKLAELQRQRPDQGELILTPEQRAELERFNEERVATRRQLRTVQLNQRRDIERLETLLQAINLGAAPLLIALIAIGLGVYRFGRRRVVRRTRHN